MQTMKACKKCGSTIEGKTCKPCMREYHAAWRENNREKCRKAVAKWAANHVEEKKQYDALRNSVDKEVKAKIRRERYAENREKILQQKRSRYLAGAHDKSRIAYREKNKERIAEYAREWRINNPEKTASYYKKWRHSNPEVVRLFSHTRRAKKCGGKLSVGLAEKLFQLQRGKCACGCNRPLGDDYHLDHIMPLALGGTNTDENIQLLRATCNRQKSAKHPVDFMQQRGFLL